LEGEKEEVEQGEKQRLIDDSQVVVEKCKVVSG